MKPAAALLHIERGLSSPPFERDEAGLLKSKMHAVLDRSGWHAGRKKTRIEIGPPNGGLGALSTTKPQRFFSLGVIMRKRSLLLVSLCLFFSLIAIPPVGATTVVPPDNLGHLARISRTVVFAHALESRVEEGETLPYTITRFQLVDRIAGDSPGTVFEVREPGGTLGTVGAVVPGAPRFEEGRNYLLFLDPAPGGRWRSKTMAYGLLEEDERSGELRPLPQAPRIELKARGAFEPVGVYHKDALLQHLKEVARGAPWNRQQVAAAEQGQPLESAFDAIYDGPAECAFITHTDGIPVRWFGYEAGSKTSTIVPTTPGQNGLADGGLAALQKGVASWTNHPDSVIRFTVGASRPQNVVCSNAVNDGDVDVVDDGAVLFSDPCNDLTDLSNCVGTLAFGGTTFLLSTQSYDGHPWHPALTTWVVVNNGVECVGATNFEEILGHELGHVQGFGHHTPANKTDALMSSQLKGDGLGAALRPTDKRCASYAYHTFLDVPFSHWSWPFIEALENSGMSGGCGSGNYCPQNDVTRAEMAVFLVRGVHGSNYNPPAASGTVFQDVPASYWAAAFIEQLYRDGFTGGCRPGFYCPTNSVNRAEMAVFLVKARHGVGFTPPPATGTVFADVPASHWAAPFIEQIFRDGITAGCGSGSYCPNGIVSREQMAAFLARTFNLPLP